MAATSRTAPSDAGRLKQRWSSLLLAPLWDSPTAHKPPDQPRRGHCWHWEDVLRSAQEAASLTSPEVVERRVLRLVNPDPVSPQDESTVGNLSAAIQILLPGEVARPHRHSMHALRFVLQGDGATTFVNGQALPMRPGDMLLTPGNCWHEHRHDGSEPVIWLDVLDVPLHTALGTGTFQPGPVIDCPPTLPTEAWSAAGGLPIDAGGSQSYSPLFHYPAEAVNAALARVPAGPGGMRAVRYVNPSTGGAPMPTIDCTMVSLEAGQMVPETRSTANAVCLIVDGEGETWVGDQHFEWSRYDILTFPQKNWIRHRARSAARLFLVSDRGALRRLDLLEETQR